MNDFSPTAQEILNQFVMGACGKTYDIHAGLAAALRAAADQVEDLEVPWSYMGDSFRVYEHGQTSAAEHLRVITAELETSTPENR